MMQSPLGLARDWALAPSGISRRLRAPDFPPLNQLDSPRAGIWHGVWFYIRGHACEACFVGPWLSDTARTA